MGILKSLCFAFNSLPYTVPKIFYVRITCCFSIFRNELCFKNIYRNAINLKKSRLKALNNYKVPVKESILILCQDFIKLCTLLIFRDFILHTCLNLNSPLTAFACEIQNFKWTLLSRKGCSVLGLYTYFLMYAS